MSNINYAYITEYIRNLTPQKDELLREMEKYAEINHVPIARPEAMRLIEVLCKAANVKSTLEIGMAIGYSAICMTKATMGSVTGIELSEDMIQIAKKNIEKAGFTSQITILHGDAAEVLKEINDSFDLIFIDAAKGQYLNYFKECYRLIKSGGVIISDNVLYNGTVANDELVTKRNKTIVQRMREYTEYVMNDKSFDSSLIPVGDGLLISYKK